MNTKEIESLFLKFQELEQKWTAEVKNIGNEIDNLPEDEYGDAPHADLETLIDKKSTAELIEHCILQIRYNLENIQELMTTNNLKTI